MCIITLAGALPGWSGTLALWSFDGNGTVPVNSTAVGVTAGDLTQVNLTNASSSSLFFSASDWPVGNYGNSYFEFSITPDSGLALDFTSGTMDYVIGTNPSFTIELFSSADGFTTALSSHTDSAGIQSYSDSLAAIGSQSGTVTFRLYGFVDTTSGQSGFYGGSMALNGSLVESVPEPASWMLVAGGGLALIGLSRRRRAVLRQVHLRRAARAV